MAQDGGGTNPLARHGGVSYLEIPALDPRRSADFYARVFGWQIDQRTSDDFRFSDGAGLLIGRFALGSVASRNAAAKSSSRPTRKATCAWPGCATPPVTCSACGSSRVGDLCPRS